MGFFSWKTSDTDESIYNEHTSKCKIVYLLQPNGKPAIKETSYDGYGRFDGIDAYEWLTKNNLAEDVINKLEAEGAEALRIYAIENLASFASMFILKSTNEKFRRSDIIDLANDITFETKQERFGNKTLNEMLQSKEMVQMKSDIPVPFPLKFSFNEHAIYEDLPAAEDCPDQGFF